MEFQPIQTGSEWSAFNLQGGLQQQIHKNLNVGVGVGVTESWIFDEGPLVPIFLRGEVSTEISKLTPFLSFDIGYEVFTGDPECAIVLVNPMIGLKFGSWYGGIGYLGHCVISTAAINTFNVKIGYVF